LNNIGGWMMTLVIWEFINQISFIRLSFCFGDVNQTKCKPDEVWSGLHPQNKMTTEWYPSGSSPTLSFLVTIVEKSFLLFNDPLNLQKYHCKRRIWAKWDDVSLYSTCVEMKNALCSFLIRLIKVFLVI